MKQSLANFVRALAVLLLFVPAPLAVVGAPAAYADAEVVAAEPAVVVPEEVEADEEDPWTARFLAPAVAVLGAIVIGASVSYYVVRVRGRYRVV